MDRVIAFIDGFNMYHSLCENRCDNLKWINYWSLASAFIRNRTEKLVNVFYFSALTPWDNEKMNRHKLYIKALESQGVKVILGKFKKVKKKCRADCKKLYITFEEKETDVNIAVTMLREAINDNFDKAILFSGDSDMIAGIRALKTIAPHKHIHVVIPYKRSSIDLISYCDSNSKIKRSHLERNQLPEQIELGIGTGKFLERPQEWK